MPSNLILNEMFTSEPFITAAQEKLLFIQSSYDYFIRSNSSFHLWELTVRHESERLLYPDYFFIHHEGHSHFQGFMYQGKIKNLTIISGVKKRWIEKPCLGWLSWIVWSVFAEVLRPPRTLLKHFRGLSFMVKMFRCHLKEYLPPFGTCCLLPGRENKRLTPNQTRSQAASWKEIHLCVVDETKQQKNNIKSSFVLL